MMRQPPDGRLCQQRQARPRSAPPLLSRSSAAPLDLATVAVAVQGHVEIVGRSGRGHQGRRSRFAPAMARIGRCTRTAVARPVDEPPRSDGPTSSRPTRRPCSITSAAAADLIVPLANGEPVVLLDALERHADRLRRVRVHQMHALHDRPYLHGVDGRLAAPRLLLLVARHPAVLPRRHGRPRAEQLQRDARRPAGGAPPTRWSSPRRRRRTVTATSASGVNADYTASFIGKARFFLEANRRMPRTFGRNQLHISQVVGWCESDYPLLEVPPGGRSATPIGASAQLVAERIRNGSTVQVGIGGDPQRRARRARRRTATSACTPS